MKETEFLYCLNTELHKGHANPKHLLRCQQCTFLLKGAHIDKYQIVSYIAGGGFGEVYEVRELSPLGDTRSLALKILRADKVDDIVSSKFIDEAKRIAQLEHENILPVYSYGQLEGRQAYIVMGRASGNLLERFSKFDKRGKLVSRKLATVEELVPYLEQAAEALDYMHNNNFIHQDVKPINLLIGSKQQILLADFGTSLDLGLDTHASLMGYEGTYRYMPFEQLKGKPRRESDQYALAVSFYELLAGRTPFEYPTAIEMIDANQSKQPPSPQKFNPLIPQEIVAILLRAMARQYQFRYPSNLDFAKSYSNAVKLIQKRYLCQQCEYQNQIGSKQCSLCSATIDNRRCQWCGTLSRFGQRCCSACGRLTITQITLLPNPFLGLGVQKGHYIFRRVLSNSEKTKVLVAIANDTQAYEQKVVLKRWECSPSRFAQELIHYANKTEPLTHLRHNLVPHVIDRFPDETFYYLVMTYIDGESITELLQKQIGPLLESKVLSYMNMLLNILISLEQHRPPLRHFDISPSNIIIDKRGRACLTGFQVPSPSLSEMQNRPSIHHATQSLAISPYLPVQDKPYDQRTCIYSLAACMHYALTNFPPPHYPFYPPVRQLNSAISSAFEFILNRALMEDSKSRYQSYEEMQRDIKSCSETI